MKNPFEYGGVVSGKAFCNRDKEVTDLLDVWGQYTPFGRKTEQVCSQMDEARAGSGIESRLSK